MNIVSALMKENIRLSNGNRWLVFSDGQWVVYEHKYGAKKVTTLIQTNDQDEAVDYLMEVKS